MSRSDFGLIACRGVLLGLIAATIVAARVAVGDDFPRVTRADINNVAHEIYIYGYPLVTMEMTRRVMTNTDVPKDSHAPMGQFYHSRTYPNASFRDVTAPNADTLYSTAWLDLSKEPYVLSLPEQKDRYYLVPLLDAWTNVFQVPGTRTTGDKAQKYAITGPGWSGKLPEGVTEYKSPTNLVWILGRTYCTGTPEDYKAVHALQDQYTLVPLSAYGKPYTPPKGTVDPKIDMKTAVREQVNAMGPEEYYSLLAALMKDNPPAKEDEPIVAKMAKIGLVPGKKWEFKKIDPNVATMFDSNLRRARIQIQGQSAVRGQTGQQLGNDHEDREVRNRLRSARLRDLDRPGGQSAARRGVSGCFYEHRRPPTDRRKQIRDALWQQERVAAGQRVLVADDVQHRNVFRRESAESIHLERAKQFEDRIATARSTCTFRKIRRGRIRNRIGCPRRRRILI